ncbi:MAG: hypothetical protein WC627_08335 [Legionella sp.]|jgi:hypothetical protein
MKKLCTLATMMLLISSSAINAEQATSKRIPQLENSKVKVWKTIIYPSAKQALPMHRHESDRVVVALTDGKFKVTNNKGKVHYFTLKKDKAYFFSKDKPNELHNDENLSGHPIKVMVIELH